MPDDGPLNAATAPAPPAAPDVWLDVGQAAVLLRVPVPSFDAMVADGPIASRLSPGGRPGVMKADVLAWQRSDHAARRAALVELAAGVDLEVFG